MNPWSRQLTVATVLFVALCAIAGAVDNLPLLTPPAPGTWIYDSRGVVAQEDVAEIQARCSDVYADTGVPIQVVIIRTMSRYTGEDSSIEAFARSVFERWGRDPDFAYEEHWRKGILLLVCLDDRKARIELGADWAGEADSQSTQIMQSYIVPEFKAGSYSKGIVAGVDGLADLARGKSSGLTAHRVWRWFLKEIVLSEFFFKFIIPLTICIFFARFLGKGSNSVETDDSSDTIDNERDYDGGTDHSDYGGGGGATGSW